MQNTHSHTQIAGGPQPQNPKYKNPLFSHGEAHKKSSRYLIPALSIGLAALLALYFIFIANDSWKISVAQYSGNTRITTDMLNNELNHYVRGHAFLIIPKKNILFFNTKDVANHLKNTFSLEQVAIEKIIVRRLIHITVIEKPLQYVLSSNGTMRFVAADGSVLEELNEEMRKNPTNLFVIELEESRDESKPLASDLLETAQEVIQFTHGKEISVNKISIKNEGASDIKIYTGAGWYIYIDKSRNKQEQLMTAFTIYIEKYQHSNSQPNEYIDVRLPDRAFTK